MILSLSAKTLIGKVGSSSTMVIAFSRKSWLVEATASLRTSVRSMFSINQSARPDSILARSRTSLMSLVSRSVSFTIISRYLWRSSWPISSLSCNISEKARTEVKGVRSSWLTVETNSSFNRSSSFSLLFASCSSLVAASSSRDFSSSW